MSRASKAECKQAIADAAYWHELEKYLPWKLHGFTFRSGANYHTGGARFSSDPIYNALVPPASNPCAFVSLTGAQRDQLVTAFKERDR